MKEKLLHKIFLKNLKENKLQLFESGQLGQNVSLPIFFYFKKFYAFYFNLFAKKQPKVLGGKKKSFQINTPAVLSQMPPSCFAFFPENTKSDFTVRSYSVQKTFGHLLEVVCIEDNRLISPPLLTPCGLISLQPQKIAL